MNTFEVTSTSQKKVVQNFFFFLFLSDQEQREHQMVPRDKGTTLHLNDFQNKQKTEIEEEKKCK